MGDHGNMNDLTAALALIQQQMLTQQQQMLQMQQTIQNQQQAAQEQAAANAAREERGALIGERNLPRNFSTNRSPINPPPCTRQDYEIKPALIGLVQKSTFSGLTSDIPMEHIEAFERICNFSRSNGVPPDYVKCTLFPFSLEGKASRRLQSLPTGSLTSWDQVFYDGVSYEFQNTLDSSSNGDFMTQTTPGAFALIENMTSSSLNKNKEHDRSKSVNIIDDLAAKGDQLLKGNQSQVFIMEEETPEKSVGDLAFEAELSGDDQQEVRYVNGQGWQLKNYHPNPNVRNNQQLFWPKQDKPMILHRVTKQLLQGQQLQGKALNQVTTEINTRMNHMFRDLSTKYDNVVSHMRQIDIQIAQTAESVKRQQGTLPGKTDKTPKECKSGKQLSEPEKRRFTTGEKGKQKESKQLPADTPTVERNTEPAVGRSSPGPEQPAEVVRPIPEVVPPREYIPKSLTLQIKKRGDPGKFDLSIQIGKTGFACSLVDLGSSVNLMPYSVARRLGYTHFKPTKMSLVFADRSVKSLVGILEDLQVKVGNTSVPADFVVLEQEEESKDPLILGRPILCIVGAIIDVRQGKIDLNLGDIVMQFEMDELLKKPMLDG
ncbi:PREDICTED: uncharacterized protein LOC106324096 [Brassica oleracea var. oleracea]|uniref:uncharacterized protein LOC106324096 n=1 Tax=Brassica oleracea var. oleracea TaxID=109376 RepID=UPI0006A6A8C1|nr:PREDICTED: uncharacterized protein LOC106324096 [Brassica oleracea var. oleracea]